MKSTPFSGKDLLKTLAEGGKLTPEQMQAHANKTLTAVFHEFYHRSQIANTGSATGVALYNAIANAEAGITNLAIGCALPDDFALIATKGRVAVWADDADGAISAAQIKAGSFDNMVLNVGGTTVRIPAPILNSGFILKINDIEEARYGAKNYLMQGNRKEYIEASLQDAIEMPAGVRILKKGTTLKPELLLPVDVPLSATAIGAGSFQYAWETTYVGFRLIIK